jgi:hypothetical protein
MNLVVVKPAVMNEVDGGADSHWGLSINRVVPVGFE